MLIFKVLVIVGVLALVAYAIISKIKKRERLTYQALIRGYKNKGYNLESYGAVTETAEGLPGYPAATEYKLYKMVLNPECEKTLLITTGFHGEEFNGPISLLGIIDEVAAFAKEMGVRLIVYLCVNPAGFDLHQRYNPSDTLVYGNNDFLRYLIENGEWVGTLEPGQNFLDWKIVDSAAKEVRLLNRDLVQYRKKPPRGVFDAHQDHLKKGQGNFYAYIFNKREVYLKIMKELAKITDVSKNIQAVNTEGTNGNRKVSYNIDDDGFIFLHDGSITDMFYRLGSEFAVCAETNTDLPLDKVCQINLTWIKEMIKLVAK